MIKKTKKKRGGRIRVEESDSDDSDDEDVYSRKRRGKYSRGLAHYDLAVPMTGMGMMPAMMGARPMMATPVMMAPAMPMMTTGAATFQPTYGVVPMM